MCDITTKFASWPLTAMSEDHTRSLVPYREILESHEQEYRGSDGDDRSAVIGEIAQEIRKAASLRRAKITRGEDLENIRGVLVL